jgi:hypothetical protein
MAAWTPLEYLLHRFVLHGVQPFSNWHALHHERPTALICSPTVLSASVLIGLVFLPIGLVSNRWFATALTLGLLLGYQAYALTHHVVHHGAARRLVRREPFRRGYWQSWLAQRKRWHALHHHSLPLSHFGVTTDLWDRLLRTGAEANRATVARKTQPPMYDSEQTSTARFFTTGHWMRRRHPNPVMAVPACVGLIPRPTLPGLLQPMAFWQGPAAVTLLTDFNNERKT